MLMLRGRSLGSVATQVLLHEEQEKGCNHKSFIKQIHISRLQAQTVGRLLIDQAYKTCRANLNKQKRSVKKFRTRRDELDLRWILMWMWHKFCKLRVNTNTKGSLFYLPEKYLLGYFITCDSLFE